MDEEKRNNLFMSIFIKEILKTFPSFEDLWKKKDNGEIWRYDTYSENDEETEYNELDFRNISRLVFSIWRKSTDFNSVEILFVLENKDGEDEYVDFNRIFNEKDLMYINENFPKIKELMQDGILDIHESEFWPKKIKKLARQVSLAFESVIINHNDK